MRKCIFLTFCFMLTLSPPAFSGLLDQNNIAGFISQGFMYTTDNNFHTNTEDGSFQFNEIGFNINKRISTKMTAGIQFLSYTTGNIGNNEINVDWGFADFRYNSLFGLRAGILKAPLGFYNETRDIDASLLYIFLPSSVYQTSFRDTVLRISGLSVYGDFFNDTIGEFYYQFMAGKPDLDENSVTAKAFFDTYTIPIHVEDINVKTDYIFNVKWYTPIEGVILSWVYRHSEMDTVSTLPDAGGIRFYMALPEIIYQTFSVKYELKALIINFELFDLQTTYENPLNFKKASAQRQGWYADIQYTFTDFLQVGCFYSMLYADMDDKKGRSDIYDPDFTAWQEDICTSIRVDISDAWILKFEAHIMNGTLSIFKSDNLDNGGNLALKEDWVLFASKLSYLF